MFTGAHPALQRALEAHGYTEPTPVQAAILEAEPGRDLTVSSRTGSGKTVAFGLAFASLILGDAPLAPKAGKPLALIVAPTRELALQVARELAWLYEHAGVRVVSCVGGMDPRREAVELHRGAHLVVGTPGRLCDHVNRKQLDLTAIRALVLDEADEMLDLGFREELELLLQGTPPERRTLLFSATMPPEALELANRYQKDPQRIAATKTGESHSDITYRAILIANREREHAVVNVLRILEPPGALVFCNTREGVHHLHTNLVERGFSAVAISGEFSQNERTRALQQLRDGRAKVLVATDVAARGLDLPDLGLVIHADLPNDAQVMQHRSGRTGRAGRKGVSVLLVPNSRAKVAERLFREGRITVSWMDPPTVEAIEKRDEERLMERLGVAITEPDDADRAFAALLLEKYPAADLVALLAKSQRGELPAPEEMFETQALRERKRIAPPTPPVTDGVWFAVNIGREQRAHAHWLIPLICRRGKVDKAAIGRLQVGDHETRFPIAEGAAEAFAENARKADRKEPEIKFRKI